MKREIERELPVDQDCKSIFLQFSSQRSSSGISFCPIKLRVERRNEQEGSVGGIVLACAILLLFLASVGLYGVVWYLTTQRTTELGIRMALGAQTEQLLQLMLIDGLRPALFG